MIDKYMPTIQTREQGNGQWWCNATIHGYDYSFNASGVLEAHSKMIEFLNTRNINPKDCTWEEVKRYPKRNLDTATSSGVGYQIVRIDINPIG